MSKNTAINWSVGILAGAALGGAVWFALRRSSRADLAGKIQDVAEDARSKAGGLAHNLREKAMPIVRTVADLVEKNAELVSAVANVSAEQVRKTGQEIMQFAETLDKNLEAFEGG